MKSGIVFVLVGLLALWAAPTFSEMGPVELQASVIPDAARPDDGAADQPAGPRRDPFGNDWIFYDDGNFEVYYTATNLYVRVMFQPNTEFQLQGVRVMPINLYDVDDPFNVYVYRQDQANNLTERVYAGRLDRVPVWDRNDFEANWVDFEFAENQYVHFDQNENFSVVCGVYPGGNLNNEGTGYCPPADGASALQRGYLVQVANLNAAVPTPHRNWARLQNDLLLRANGDYLANFIDVGVLDVFNGEPGEAQSGHYQLLPETEVSLKARLAVNGNDVDAMLLTFIVQDVEGNQVWSYDQLVEELPGGDTVVVVCDSVWITDALGRYLVWATAQVQDDSNGDNDQAGLELTVFDPVNDADTWISFCDGEMESDINGEGYAAVFGHPGGDQLLWVTAARFQVLPADAQEYELPVMIRVLNLSDMTDTRGAEDTLWTDGSDAAQWVELALDPADYVTIEDGQAALVTVLMPDGIRIKIDSSLPTSGTNQMMPSSMRSYFGGSYFEANSGDYAIETKFALSDEAPPGPRLIIDPDTLDFGDVTVGEDHVIEARFISIGADTVRVTNLAIAPAIRNLVRVSETRFNVASLDTFSVQVTLHANDTMAIASRIAVSSNWLDHRLYYWPVLAHVLPLSVSEHVRPGLPSSCSLEQNYPNPFNPTTNIGFALARSSDVTFSVYDLTGGLVRDAFQGRLGAGYHSFKLDAADLPAGVYLYRLTAGEFSSAKKMILMK